MNKIMLMSGSIILLWIIFLTIMPNYEKYLKSKNYRNGNYIDIEDYNRRCTILSFLLSLMINFLIWGFII